MNRRAASGVLTGICLCLVAGLPRAAEAQDVEDPPYWQDNANIGLGLFQSVSLAPFPSLRAGLGVRLPSSLLEDGVEFHVNEDWARMLSVTDQWLLEYDVLRSNVGVTLGLTNDLRLGLDFESATRTTGYLETFIIGFHRTFNISIGNRRQYQDHPQTILIKAPNGSTVFIDQHDPQPYAQALIGNAEYSILRGDDTLPDVQASVSLRGAFHSGDLSGGSPIDVGGSLSAAKSWGPVNFYLGSAVSWYGTEDLQGLPLKSVQWQGIFGLEVRVATWFSVTGQWLITSGGAEGLSDLSRPSHEVTAGFKWDLGKGYLLETAILENIINPYNTPDFGVHFSFAVRW